MAILNFAVHSSMRMKKAMAECSATRPLDRSHTPANVSVMLSYKKGATMYKNKLITPDQAPQAPNPKASILQKKRVMPNIFKSIGYYLIITWAYLT